MKATQVVTSPKRFISIMQSAKKIYGYTAVEKAVYAGWLGCAPFEDAWGFIMARICLGTVYWSEPETEFYDCYDIL